MPTPAGLNVKTNGLWNEPEWLNTAEEFAKCINDGVEHDSMYDWMAGSAGYAAVLGSLFEVSHSPTAVAGIVRCAEHLMKTARPSVAGCGWQADWTGNVALTGFGHGNAGIGLALLRAGKITGDDRYTKLALSALEYERAHFDGERQDWKDLRSHADDNAGTSMPWCYGAPGIGMARLAGLPMADDAATRSEIRVAIAQTNANGFGRSHCLCHGDLGNIELLLLSNLVLNDGEALRTARLRAADCLGVPPEFGTPYGLETPGLMTGASGIGYGFLRVARPDLVPGLLTLEPPRT